MKDDLTFSIACLFSSPSCKGESNGPALFDYEWISKVPINAFSFEKGSRSRGNLFCHFFD